MHFVLDISSNVDLSEWRRPLELSISWVYLRRQMCSGTSTDVLFFYTGNLCMDVCVLGCCFCRIYARIIRHVIDSLLFSNYLSLNCWFLGYACSSCYIERSYNDQFIMLCASTSNLPVKPALRNGTTPEPSRNKQRRQLRSSANAHPRLFPRLIPVCLTSRLSLCASLTFKNVDFGLRGEQLHTRLFQ